MVGQIEYISLQTMWGDEDAIWSASSPLLERKTRIANAITHRVTMPIIPSFQL